jgi:hypothetical protein
MLAMIVISLFCTLALSETFESDLPDGRAPAKAPSGALSPAE